MKVLITGLTSKIGMELVPLLRSKHHVITGISRKRVQSPGARVWVHDLTKPLVASSTFDVVVHAAGYVPYNTFQKDDDLSKNFAGNVISTHHVLDYCAIRKVKRLILISSLDVYGPLKGTIRETTPTWATSHYGLSKLFAEKLSQNYSAQFGFDLVILRCGPLYGCYMADSLFLKKLIQEARAGRTVRLDRHRNLALLHTKDFASVIEQSFRVKPGCYNVTGEPIGFEDIVRILQKKYDFKPIFSSRASAGVNMDRSAFKKHFRLKRLTRFEDGYPDILH